MMKRRRRSNSGRSNPVVEGPPQAQSSSSKLITLPAYDALALLPLPTNNPYSNLAGDAPSCFDRVQFISQIVAYFTD